MERFKLDNDKMVFCVTATSFPAGISPAHEKLRALLPTLEGRNFYGISCPNEQGIIVYKAAVEQEYDGEAEKMKCEIMTLKKGDYIGKIIYNFQSDAQQIKNAFQILLSDPGIDPKGYCVEHYLNEKDVLCMVRLDMSI